MWLAVGLKASNQRGQAVSRAEPRKWKHLRPGKATEENTGKPVPSAYDLHRTRTCNPEDWRRSKESALLINFDPSLCPISSGYFKLQ